MHVHRRQFVIGPCPINSVPGWVTTYIPGTGYLCHCPELCVVSAKDRNGIVWHLLGLAIQTDTNKLDPVDEIATGANNTIQDLYQSWEGRWVLIGDGKLHMDAAGLLGCFYGLRETNQARELWVSSSSSVLADWLNVDTTPTRLIEHGRRMDWYPGPQSGFKSIRRLLPSQILVLATGDLLARRLVPEILQPLSYDDLLNRMQKYLVTAIEQASKLSNNLWLSLTAGYDTRLLLAAAHYAGVPVKTYTQGSKYASDADLTLPPKLASAAGYNHSVSWGGEFRQDLAAFYNQHTGGHCAPLQRYNPLDEDFFNWCQKGDILLRGGCLPIGSCHYWKRFPESDLQDVEVILNRFKEDFHPLLVHAIQEWVAWSTHTPHKEVDWRERLYWEQRVAGWLSSAEQSLDLIDAVSINPGNSHVYYSYVLQIPEEKRRGKRHHVDLIKRMAPGLLEFPFNPSRPTPIYKRLSRKIKRILSSFT